MPYDALQSWGIIFLARIVMPANLHWMIELDGCWSNKFDPTVLVE